MRARTLVELSGTARFTGWEIHCLGRPAIGERFATGTADFLLNVQRDCRPLLRDRLRVSEGTGLDGPSGLRGFPVCGTFVATGAGPQDLDAAREILPHERGFPIGLTLIEDLIVARCLAPTAEPASRIFRSLWCILRPRLSGRDACPPRIWSTSTKCSEIRRSRPLCARASVCKPFSRSELLKISLALERCCAFGPIDLGPF